MLLKILRALAETCHFCLKKQTITWQLTNSTKFGNIKLKKKIRRSKIVEDNTTDELQQMYCALTTKTGQEKEKLNLTSA